MQRREEEGPHRRIDVVEEGVCPFESRQAFQRVPRRLIDMPVTWERRARRHADGRVVPSSGPAMLRLFRRLLLRTLPVQDPWRRYRIAVPAARYGIGAHRDFAWYFQRESSVEVVSVACLREWLLGCEYVRDHDLFQRPDVWQHPSDFERMRKGDCEDFALWTWRKLTELGFEAELVAGHYAHPAPHAASSACGHAWVVFHDGKEIYVFDPVIRDPGVMIRPLRESRHEYLPECSVDARFNRYVYGGYVQHLRQRTRAAQSGLPAVVRIAYARIRQARRQAASPAR